jgi:hypothetical protein
VYEPAFPLVICADESSATTPRPHIPKELAVGKTYQQHPDEDERNVAEAPGVPIET